MKTQRSPLLRKSLMKPSLDTNKKTYRVISLMSGTSLDGLDIALVDFSKEDHWKYELRHAVTYAYPSDWAEKLKFRSDHSAEDLLLLDHEYGQHLAKEISRFMEEYGLSKSTIDLISSHGHTLYHQPDSGYTFQLGNGPEIFALNSIPTVCDFRRQDIALGGQGAPLVPIGDRYLFSSYDACLNLGGFANISFETAGKRIAFDICPVNYVLNHFAQRQGLKYDEGGAIARSGRVQEELLQELNNLDFYQAPPPKSLGAEWVNRFIFPLLDRYTLNTQDATATFAEHICVQLSDVLSRHELNTVLVSGGGAYNSHLITLLQSKSKARIHIPPAPVIDFKEAIVFGLLGVLKWRGETNVLHSVTGAQKDHSSGIIYR